MQYVLNVIDDRSESATPEEQEAISAFNGRMKEQGSWVFAAGLADPASSTVVDGRGETPVLTDGPFVETKEYVAGVWIIEAADLDEALALAVEGSRHCNRRLEVRPV